MTEQALELANLSNDPVEEWQRMLRFSGLNGDDREAMYRTVEPLLQRAQELVVNTYEYLRSVPETAAILHWEQEIDQAHLEERRRFFTIWLARTLAVDSSEEFASYLFKAGKYHAGQGPRQIHTPSPYVTISIGMVLATFARYMVEAGLSGEVIAPAMAGWSKYLSVQLNQMLFGYQIALEFIQGNISIPVSVYGKMRPLIGEKEVIVHVDEGTNVAEILRKFFNYFPQARSEALDRVWRSEEKNDSLWVEVTPAYLPRNGWRVLLNGRDLTYEGGWETVVHKRDQIAIFPPGR